MSEVSLSPIRSLLYKGCTSIICAHYMACYGQKSHVDVGYSSKDPVVVAGHLKMLAALGNQVVIPDWYGNGDVWIDTSCKLVRDEAVRRGDTQIAMCLDGGMMNHRGTTPQTDYLIQQIKYVKATYCSSPCYHRTRDGRYLMLEFGIDATAVDWNKVVAMFPEVAFLHRNSDTDVVNYSGFNKPGAGAFSWLDAKTSSAKYLSDFYLAALKYPTKITMGSAWAFFDDRQASWTQNRVVDGRNGQLWLETFDATNAVYGVTRQLEYLQLVTFNDWDEKSALERGIESGISLTSSKLGSVCRVGISGGGNLNMIDHFEGSVNGGAFSQLAGSSLDLSAIYTEPGTYAAAFKAAMRPFGINKYSPSIAAVAVPGPLVWS